MKTWVAGQSDSIDVLDSRSRQFGNDALAFRIALKFIESEQAVERLDRPVTLPQLALRVTDTNRAFKAFESSALAKILPSIQIYTFPYQIELLQACISMNVRLTKKGISYVDSVTASTQSGDNITESYLNQIHQIIDVARR